MLQVAGFVLGPVLIVLGLFMFIFGPRLMRETDRLRDGPGGEPTLSGLRTPRAGGIGFIVGGILVLVIDVIYTVQNS
jgi:UDP-N-acetylmuramyl pentapeptide phosphotransferase/UDP-N-acetylglucosamine-1-phosphate transferase